MAQQLKFERLDLSHPSVHFLSTLNEESNPFEVSNHCFIVLSQLLLRREPQTPDSFELTDGSKMVFKPAAAVANSHFTCECLAESFLIMFPHFYTTRWFCQLCRHVWGTTSASSPEALQLLRANECGLIYNEDVLSYFRALFPILAPRDQFLRDTKVLITRIEEEFPSLPKTLIGYIRHGFASVSSCFLFQSPVFRAGGEQASALSTDIIRMSMQGVAEILSDPVPMPMASSCLEDHEVIQRHVGPFIISRTVSVALHNMAIFCDHMAGTIQAQAGYFFGLMGPGMLARLVEHFLLYQHYVSRYCLLIPGPAALPNGATGSRASSDSRVGRFTMRAMKTLGVLLSSPDLRVPGADGDGEGEGSYSGSDSHLLPAHSLIAAMRGGITPLRAGSSGWSSSVPPLASSVEHEEDPFVIHSLLIAMSKGSIQDLSNWIDLVHDRCEGDVDRLYGMNPVDQHLMCIASSIHLAQLWLSPARRAWGEELVDWCQMCLAHAEESEADESEPSIDL